jgi:hypothetical protein
MTIGKFSCTIRITSLYAAALALIVISGAVEAKAQSSGCNYIRGGGWNATVLAGQNYSVNAPFDPGDIVVTSFSGSGGATNGFYSYFGPNAYVLGGSLSNGGSGNYTGLPPNATIKANGDFSDPTNTGWMNFTVQGQTGASVKVTVLCIPADAGRGEGCQSLQAAPMASLGPGISTGVYPGDSNSFFFQGDIVGVDWTPGQPVTIRIWRANSQGQKQGQQPLFTGDFTQGTVRYLLGYPANYFAVELINNGTQPISYVWLCFGRRHQQPNAPPVVAHDFNNDTYSDITWVSTSGAAASAPNSNASSNVAIWLMKGASVLSSAAVATVPASYSIVGQRDFDGDGNTDLLWRDTSGNLAMWFMNGLTVASTAMVGNVPTNWTVKGTINGDILWQDTVGNLALWLMAGNQVTSTVSLGIVPTASTWSIVATDSVDHVLWRDGSGNVAMWQVDPLAIQTQVFGTVPSNWQALHLGDFNGDGNPDILWRDATSGAVAIWFLANDMHLQSAAFIAAVPGNWNIVQTGDYNGDGFSDILWLDGTGNLAAWFMNGSQVAATASYGNVGTSWSVQAQNAE